ncbi:MAG TPA: aspartate/glutamate racemase family protein [Nocardioides sp.]|uniref:aspartate/glutamate racemase family protein n=1 Tax=Nocardioides sp. TaxID=35761 RepID=UPI002E2F4F89|nr:aspartate/glutamate racemase family protein [Nocardioides sp.]HEX5089790.1 aspartate/glutamate racemase family protein [Nocardioides sp.]
MKTIGLVGGMSWHSTVEYYRVINELVAERQGGHASARVTLQSLDFAEVRACQVKGDWARAGRLLADAAQSCERSGADVVLICTNLMHRVADDVQAAIDVPLLHIADAIADRARDEGWSRLGVLGARWVMEEDFYVGRLAGHGLDVVVPGPDDRTEVDRVIFEELTRGIVREESRAAYAGILGRLADQGAEAVVLGCTEIELLVRPEDAPLPVLASMRTHAEAAVAVALGDRVAA